MSLPDPHRIRIGDHFGRWTVTGERVMIAAGRAGKRVSAHDCRCQCGQERRVIARDLCRGHSTSCGCWRRERTSERSRTHGCSRERLYFTWRGMLRRCHNPAFRQYRDYGGRGITVCPEW